MRIAAVIPALNDQFNFIRTNGFNPQKTAILEQEISGVIYHPNSYAEIIYWSPDKIEIQAEVHTDQLLVLSEMYYSEGWEISSHSDWKILPVNSILRGIQIPSGKHHIVMEFIPDDVWYGSLITWISTGILILFILSGLIIKCNKDESNSKTIYYKT